MRDRFFKLDYRRAPSLVGLWGPGPPGGPLLYDKSGRGNDGTPTNGPTWVADPERGWVLNYVGGSSQYVDVGIQAPKGSMSFSAWIRASATVGSIQYIMGVQNSGDSGGRLLRYRGDVGDDTLEFLVIRDGGDQYYARVLAPALLWHHVMAVLDAINDNVLLYVNGVPATTAAAGAYQIQVAASLKLSRRPDSAANYFSGRIDDARMFNRALSAAEVQHIFQKTKPNPYYDIAIQPRRVGKAPAVVGFTSQKALIIGGGVLGI